jgi:hypothetical protein
MDDKPKHGRPKKVDKKLRWDTPLPPSPPPKQKKKNRNPKPPPEQYRWRKGESGNTNGRHKELPELKILKNLTKKELVDIGNLVVKGNVHRLRLVAENAFDEPVIKCMMAQVCLRIMEKGDMQALDVLLNRLIGKVKDEIHHQGDFNAPQVILTLPANGRESVVSKKADHGQ